jgi:hypothetical protein
MGQTMQTAAAFVESVPEEPRRFRQEIALSDIHSPTVQRGLDIWNRVRGNRLFPARAEVTPRMLSDLLRHTTLVRVLENNEEYEIRIIGDAMVQMQGRSFQGMSTAEIDLLVPGHGLVLRTVYNEVCRRRAPLVSRGWYTREADKRTLFQETLVMPLGNNEQAVDHILAFAVYALSAEDSLR